MPYTLVRLARFGLPNPKADAIQGLDLQIQTERMGQMRLPYRFVQTSEEWAALLATVGPDAIA
jgi:hypothetical protein